MKYKTNKLQKLENSRYSILINDMDKCCVCGTPYPDVNEIFSGRNRINSIKYGLCIPLCRRCHDRYHKDRNMQLYFMKKAFNEFLKTHSIDDFKTNFKYIKGLDIF